MRRLTFLVFLIITDSVFSLTVPEKAEEEDLSAFSKPDTKFSVHYLSTLNNKFENMDKTLTAIDTSIKQLHEKAHTWAIFHHHIDSWNDQMKTIEHKINLIKRTQDENQSANQKLTSQEFILNHILSKVVYLSESCNHAKFENIIFRNRENGAGETTKTHCNDNQKVHNEMKTRLSNILRHIQNIERDNCRSNKSNFYGKDIKMAKLVHPVNSCNGSGLWDRVDFEDFEIKLNKLSESIHKDVLKQMFDNDQKNLKIWKKTLEYLEKIDDQVTRLSDSEEENVSIMSNLCQSMSSEITTFTGSSDLLLKKIEKQVMDIQKEFEKLVGIKTNKTDFRGLPNPEKNQEIDGSESDVKFQKEINGTKRFNGEVEESTLDNKDLEEPPEDINFIQPEKTGCHELTKRVNGIYKFSTPELNKAGRDLNELYCVFLIDGPAWTVIQNRGPYAVQENFNRSWNEYRDGFGSLNKDFWLGNEFIHKLAYVDNYELRIEIEDFDGVKAWVEYSTFRIDTERYNYNLIIEGHRGAIPDAMNYHNEHDFSTYDRRNDKSVDACCACATGYASGWWFNNCAEVNLNGVYHETPLGHNYVGIVWDPWHGDYSLKSSKMMLRPKVLSKEEETEIGSLEDP